MEVVNVTFEDWKKGQSLFEYGPYDKVVFHSDEQKEYRHILTADEFHKIQAAQSEISKCIISRNLEYLKNAFYEKLSKSLDKRRLVISELENVKKYLTDPNYESLIAFVCQKGEGDFVVFFGQGRKLSTYGINNLPYWFKTVVVNGESQERFIKYSQLESEILEDTEGVQVLHLYNEFLKKLLPKAKEEFLNRITLQLVGTEKGINRRIHGNIAAKAKVLTDDEVKEWATTASRELSKKLDKNGYYLVRHDLFSQNDVGGLIASDLTNLIVFDEDKYTYWNDHLECAFYWLTGAYYVQDFSDERIKKNAEKWKYKDSFRFAYEAISAVTEVKIYKEYLERHQQKTAPLRATIFTSTEAMQKALTAAAKVGILNIDGEKITWVFSGHKTHAITFFWKAAVRFGLVNSDMPMNKVIPGLKELFNYEFGVNAINQSKEVSEYPKDTQELYKRLCDEMRP